MRVLVTGRHEGSVPASREKAQGARRDVLTLTRSPDAERTLSSLAWRSPSSTSSTATVSRPTKGGPPVPLPIRWPNTAADAVPSKRARWVTGASTRPTRYRLRRLVQPADRRVIAGHGARTAGQSHARFEGIVGIRVGIIRQSPYTFPD